MSTNWSVGQAGELTVSEHYRKQGYSIIAENYQYYSLGRGRKGEIDLIAIKSNSICFVEVKTRTNTRFGHALEQISRQKLHTLQGAIKFFLLKHPQYHQLFPQIDVATIQSGILTITPNITG